MPASAAPLHDPVRIAFRASSSVTAQKALATLTGRYGQRTLDTADVIVALGGDGFMLQTLHESQNMGLPVYGMNCGTIGFMMNNLVFDQVPERLAAAEATILNPLEMCATAADGTEIRALAINEVSLLRAGPQAAKLAITVDGRMRLDELVCDGALLSTPAGSTAYNYSAHGPILPIESDVLALTAVAPFRPRRWRGALLPKAAHIRLDVIEPEKRPVMADADSRSVSNVISVLIRSEPRICHHILFDPGYGLQERLISEQFA